MAAAYAFPAVDEWFDDATINNIHKFAKAIEGAIKDNGSVNEHLFASEKESLAYDLYQNDNEYLVVFDIPGGVRKEDIGLTVTPTSQLQVTVSRSRQQFEQYNMVKKFRTMGSFQRCVSLAKDANVDDVRAKYDNGVLNVVISKKRNPSGDVKNVAIL
jgi:HSP20 family protein